MIKILGFGNALTDILLQTTDDVCLNELGLPKGSMQLVDEKKQKQISEKFQNAKKSMVAGGSAANTVNGIAYLNGKAGFIGKVGQDEVGRFFTDALQQNGVSPHMLNSDTPSGRCLVLISPDGERTMCTFLGAAAELLPSDLTKEIFTGYDIFHIEGYLVQNHALIETAVKLAKESGLLVSLDMASYNVVEDNKDFLAGLIENYIDIVFANEDEAKALTGKEPEDAVSEIAEQVSVAVVKTGAQGSFVKSGSSMYSIAAYTANCIDTTGAGDVYAAGFLYGLSCGYPINVCGKIGSLLGAKTVEVIGPKLIEDFRPFIESEIEKIIVAN